jgi:hypothetical protein
MTDNPLFDDALAYTLDAVATRAALEVIDSRAARDGLRPTSGFAAVVAWLWTTRPDLAIVLLRSFAAATQRHPRELPAPPMVHELMDEGVYLAVQPLLGNTATRSLIDAAVEGTVQQDGSTT